MLSSTLEVMRAGLKADPSISSRERIKILAYLRNGTLEPENHVAEPEAPRVLRRGEVARRLGCSLRVVDTLASNGHLARVRFPGRKRAAGFLESDVAALLSGR